MSVGAEVAHVAVKVAEQTTKQGGQIPLPNGEQSSFMNILEQHEVNMDTANADMMKALGYDPGTHPADNAVSASQLEIQFSRVEAMDSVQSSDKVANMLKELNHDGLQLERVMELVSSGTNFNQRELIALQAMVQQASLEIQIGAHAMDAAKNSIQTLIQRSVNG